MRALRTAAGTLRFSDGEPWLMATVGPGPETVERALEAVGAGARILGIRAGCRRELIGRLCEIGVPLIVRTGSPRSAEAALAAGAAIVDASAGIESPELPELCARHAAGLVVPVGTPAAATGALPAVALMHGGDAAASAAGDRPLLVHAESAELPAELAAVAQGIERGASVLGVCDVRSAADFLAVRAVLSGRREIDPAVRLAPELRREPASAAVEHPPS